MRLLHQIPRYHSIISSQLLSRTCQRTIFFAPRVPPPIAPTDQGNPSSTSESPKLSLESDRATSDTPLPKTPYELELAETLSVKLGSEDSSHSKDASATSTTANSIEIDHKRKVPETEVHQPTDNTIQKENTPNEPTVQYSNNQNQNEQPSNAQNQNKPALPQNRNNQNNQDRRQNQRVPTNTNNQNQPNQNRHNRANQANQTNQTNRNSPNRETQTNTGDTTTQQDPNVPHQTNHSHQRNRSNQSNQNQLNQRNQPQSNQQRTRREQNQQNQQNHRNQLNQQNTQTTNVKNSQNPQNQQNLQNSTDTTDTTNTQNTQNTQSTQNTQNTQSSQNQQNEVYTTENMEIQNPYYPPSQFYFPPPPPPIAPNPAVPASPYIIIPIPASHAASQFSIASPNANTWVVSFDAPMPSFLNALPTPPASNFFDVPHTDVYPPPSTEGLPAAQQAPAQPAADISDTIPPPETPQISLERLLNDQLQKALHASDMRSIRLAVSEMRKAKLRMNFQTYIDITRRAITHEDTNFLTQLLRDAPASMRGLTQNALMFAARGKRMKSVTTILQAITSQATPDLPDTFTLNAVIVAQLATHAEADALQLYERMKTWRKLNVATYASLLRSVSIDNGRRLLREMREINISQGTAAYNHFLRTLLNAGELEEMTRVFADMKENGPPPNMPTYLCMIEMNEKSHTKCKELLEEALARGLVVNSEGWGFLVRTLGAKRGFDEILTILRNNNIRPDAKTYEDLIVLKAQQEDWVACHALISDSAHLTPAPNVSLLINPLLEKAHLSVFAAQRQLIRENSPVLFKSYLLSHVTDFVKQLAEAKGNK